MKWHLILRIIPLVLGAGWCSLAAVQAQDDSFLYYRRTHGEPGFAAGQGSAPLLDAGVDPSNLG